MSFGRRFRAVLRSASVSPWTPTLATPVAVRLDRPGTIRLARPRGKR